ncbi:MAG TPA: hypothetical protein VIL77_00955 [Gaiellaceae bacterium]|jgi:hypothetical protein
MSSDLSHIATAEVAVPAERAFAYMSDGLKQGEWALGSWQREQLEPGLFRGRSLFDGAETYVRITADPEYMLVDYEVGPSATALLRVNSARIVPGPLVGRPEGTCLVSLIKWRMPTQDEDHWYRACVTFSTEIFMIKGRLEIGF